MLRPAPGSPEELRHFAELQTRLRAHYQRVFEYPLEPRTVVVVPSLSLDAELLSKIEGVQHYEERLLCLLLLLRLPRTHVVFVSSRPVHHTIIDYYLHLLHVIPGAHARARLTLLSADDSSSVPLSQKILVRPRLLERIKEAVPDTREAHISCFNASPLERTLAVQLGLPLYACDPALSYWGSKSGSRKVFKEAGVTLPPGHDDLRDEGDVVEALYALKRAQPKLGRVAVKLNDGASGEGNAVFTFNGVPEGGLKTWLKRELPRQLRFEAQEETFERFFAQFKTIGGVAECWLEGRQKRSPSVQCRVNPLGEVQLISSHDQVLGGASGQVYLGATFPADEAYRREIQEAGARIGEVLKRKGALGRFGVDFVSLKQGDAWEHYAIEINLRKGGTTHPFIMLQFLTAGDFDANTGLYLTPSGAPRYYYTTDNLVSPRYRGLTPDDLIDIAVYHGLHFHGAGQEGVVFHLIGALSEFGKLGVVCVAKSPAAAKRFYDDAVAVLDREAARTHG